MHLYTALYTVSIDLNVDLKINFSLLLIINIDKYDYKINNKTRHGKQ